MELKAFEVEDFGGTPERDRDDVVGDMVGVRAGKRRTGFVVHFQ